MPMPMWQMWRQGDSVGVGVCCGDKPQTTPNSQSVTPPHPPLESPYRTKSVVMRRAL